MGRHDLVAYQRTKKGNSDFTHNRISFKKGYEISFENGERGSFAEEFDELVLSLQSGFLILTKAYVASCLEEEAK